MVHDLANTRVTVMGLGRFGGGVGVTRWLVAQGAKALVTDLDPPEKLHQSLTQIDDLIVAKKATMRLGGHQMEDFTECDLVVANPAVPKPWSNKFLCAAQARGVPITTEIRLLTERINRTQTIGITGSAGKSTTTAMVHHVLTRAGFRAHLGGNIGGSLLNQLHQIHADDFIVLELSSAMLHWLGDESRSQSGTCNPESKTHGWSPHIGLITNIAPNHIDWHGDVEHYRQSKLNIHRFMRPGDVALDDESAGAGAPDAPLNLRVIGKHNQINARMALRVVEAATGLAFARGAELLADFPGLPHRLQFVMERDGLHFYNDSKSTTPQATVLAVESFDDPARVHLIAGGYDKGSDLQPMASLGDRIAGLYTIGKTGPALAAAANGLACSCRALPQAIEHALSRMKPGDILLLSPGCASWDQYTNYEERGDEFVKLAQHLMAGARCA